MLVWLVMRNLLIKISLRKESTKVAVLEDLSPKVMDWIEKENFKSRIGLVIKV